MPLPLALIVPFAAQIGPGGALPQAPLEIHHRREARSAPAPEPANIPAGRYAACLALTQSDPQAAAASAQAWRAGLAGPVRAQAEHCLGVAETAQGHWREAETAFTSAREATPAEDHPQRARRAAMAANAALAAGSAQRALSLLDQAHTDALAGNRDDLTGEIATDRARALVALGRSDEAAIALTEARAKAPANPQGWLLSATLARRQGKLAEAQAEIEMAAKLLPGDGEIGLEAGVIAVLSGHDDAARQSWQSVITATPGSAAAQTAKSYLDQLGPPPPPSAP